MINAKAVCNKNIREIERICKYYDIINTPLTEKGLTAIGLAAKLNFPTIIKVRKVTFYL